ncbi:BPSS1780 family membrane protein [Sphingomonas sp. NCPPB 2930]
MQLNIVPARTGLQWVRSGMRLFARQPLSLAVMFLFMQLLSSVLAVVPIVGVAVALVLTPVFLAGMVAGAHEAAQGRPARAGLLFAGLRQGKPRTVAMLLLGVFFAVACVLVMGAASLFDDGAAAGADAADAKITQETLMRDGVPGWLWFTLALTVPLLLVFSNAGALVYWYGVTPAKSLFFSLVAGLRNAGAFVVFLLGWCVVFVATGMAVGVVATLLALLLGGGSSASALLTVGLVAGAMLVIASMFFASIYPAYIACFGPPPDDTARVPHQHG